MNEQFGGARIWLNRVSVRRKLGTISEYFFKRLVKEAGFPQGRRLPGIGIEVWSEDEIENWILARATTDLEAKHG